MDGKGFIEQNWLDAYTIRNKSSMKYAIDKIYGNALEFRTTREHMLEISLDYISQFDSKYDEKSGRNRSIANVRASPFFGFTETEGFFVYKINNLSSSTIEIAANIDVSKSDEELLFSFAETVRTLRENNCIERSGELSTFTPEWITNRRMRKAGKKKAVSANEIKCRALGLWLWDEKQATGCTNMQALSKLSEKIAYLIPIYESYGLPTS